MGLFLLVNELTVGIISVNTINVYVTLEGKQYRMQVKRIHEGETIEHLEVSAGGKAVVFQTDYHYLKRTNQRKSPDWKIVSGKVKNGVGFALTVRAIEHHFRNEDDNR